MYLLSHLPRADIPELPSAAHLHVVTMGEPFVGIVHPSKIYNILYLGKPFLYIGPEQSALGRPMREEQIGSIAAHGDVKTVVKIIQRIRQLSQKNTAS